MTIFARLAAALALLACGAAHAAITCSVASPGATAAYDPASALTDVTQSFLTVTCTRGSAADPSSVAWSVRANNGQNPGGGSNRASRAGGGRINYDFYREASCATRFQNLATLTGTINFAATGTQSQQGNFWICIPAGQNVAAGTFTDRVTLTLAYGASTGVGFVDVTIVSPPTCSIPVAPGTVALSYTSLGAAATASTIFQVNCTATQAYTMALDATSGTLLGLNYTLALSSPGAVGTGGNQAHTITGTIPAGQAGTCAVGTCSATAVRTLTITY